MISSSYFNLFVILCICTCLSLHSGKTSRLRQFIEKVRPSNSRYPGISPSSSSRCVYAFMIQNPSRISLLLQVLNALEDESRMTLFNLELLEIFHGERSKCPKRIKALIDEFVCIYAHITFQTVQKRTHIINSSFLLGSLGFLRLWEVLLLSILSPFFLEAANFCVLVTLRVRQDFLSLFVGLANIREHRARLDLGTLVF
mmetsp:Transcript_11693/g.23036  ORF Transcript_11693/g.23036 Transcript_11693/m.23036 type:complete len:200 (-) Transcript_11693:622-1221(-)